MKSAVFLGLLILAAGCQSFPTGPSITVEDQKVTYSSDIIISRVYSDVPGWVVVYAASNGVPGQAIGSAHVPQGASYDIRVKVDSAGASDVLIVKLFADAGGAPGAPVIVDGKEVTTSFRWDRTFRMHM